MLVLHFDYTSLAAAVAVLRCQDLVDAGGRVGFKGIDPVGIEVSLPVTLEQYDEIERFRAEARGYGLPVRRPSRRPPTLRAHLVGDVASAQGLGAVWRDTVLRSYWGEDAALDDPDVLVELAAHAGMDPAAVRDQVEDPSAQQAVRQRMTADRGRGIGGVPLLEFDGTLLSAAISDTDLRVLAGL